MFTGSKKVARQNKNRVNFILAIIFLLGILGVVRLFSLQIINNELYNKALMKQNNIGYEVDFRRKKIFLEENKDFYEIAANKKYSLLFVNPKEIDADKIEIIAENVASILNQEKGEVFTKISDKKLSYKILAKKLEEEKVKKILDLNISGLYFSDDYYRVYPEKEIFSHITGFVGFSDLGRKGFYGVEGYFDDFLSGQIRIKGGKRDGAGVIIPTSFAKGENDEGTDLVLTISRALQFKVCNELQESIAEFRADGGTVIVMDPVGGEILSMCSFPSYDANFYNEIDNPEIFNNPAVFSSYEPGSIFKVITVAAGLDSGAISTKTVYYDSGNVVVDGHTIKNSDKKAYQDQTIAGILQKSLNTGAVYVALKTGREKFQDYIANFGFGSLTGVEIIEERAGNISSLEKKSDIYLATASFGQGITATPIQIVTAISAIANGGKLVRPTLVKKVVQEGKEKAQIEKNTKRVISKKTAKLVSKMMQSVVEKGHGKMAGVKGYTIAGKTGTAQVAKKDSLGYEDDEVIVSFVGFAPVENPLFAMLVKLDGPKDAPWAAETVAPLFGKIAKFILEYYEVPPEVN